MMQPELLQPSWHFNSYLQQNFDQAGLYDPTIDSYASEAHNFSSLITTPKDSMISSDSYSPTMLSDHFSELPNLDDVMQVIYPTENTPNHIQGAEAFLGTEVDDLLFKWWVESEEMDSISSHDSMDNEDFCSSHSTKSSEGSMASPSMYQSLVLLPEEMEVEDQTGLCHLLKAYAEATEVGQRELATVIVSCINEKISPVGETIERVAFNLFQSEGNQGDYIKQESRKNFEAAFKAFYEIFPYGRFSHFAANSAILEAIPNDVRKLHIVDFDIGEGVQWPPLIEAIGKLRKEITLTSIRKEDQGYNFEETKERLSNYARALGVKLKVQEMPISDLVRYIEGPRNRGHAQEFFAFNCMVGLPHMARRRNRSQVVEFIKVAKQIILTIKGMITFADGEDAERTKICSGYSSFFSQFLKHYQALCESMEANFPEYLTEARIAMESLFVAPYVSSLSWYQKWEEDMEDSVFEANIGLEGWKLRTECLLEAKEMVKERQNSYKIKIEGQNENEMVLEWRGTPLVRFSAWK